MKALSALGISPTPWKDHKQFVIAGDGSVIAVSNYCDVRLIAAAPELYQSVCDLLEICGNIGEYIGIDCGTIEKIDSAKKAIAKASGEEVSK